MIWFLVRFAQYDKVLWVTKPFIPNYWVTVRGNYTTKNKTDLILGSVVTNDTTILPFHKKDILKRLVA